MNMAHSEVINSLLANILPLHKMFIKSDNKYKAWTSAILYSGLIIRGEFCSILKILTMKIFRHSTEVWWSGGFDAY